MRTDLYCSILWFVSRSLPTFHSFGHTNLVFFGFAYINFITHSIYCFRLASHFFFHWKWKIWWPMIHNLFVHTFHTNHTFGCSYRAPLSKNKKKMMIKKKKKNTVLNAMHMQSMYRCTYFCTTLCSDRFGFTSFKSKFDRISFIYLFFRWHWNITMAAAAAAVSLSEPNRFGL